LASRRALKSAGQCSAAEVDGRSRQNDLAELRAGYFLDDVGDALDDLADSAANPFDNFAHTVTFLT
jgi:hypothetical protein